MGIEGTVKEEETSSVAVGRWIGSVFSSTGTDECIISIIGGWDKASVLFSDTLFSVVGDTETDNVVIIDDDGDKVVAGGVGSITTVGRPRNEAIKFLDAVDNIVVFLVLLVVSGVVVVAVVVVVVVVEHAIPVLLFSDPLPAFVPIDPLFESLTDCVDEIGMEVADFVRFFVDFSSFWGSDAVLDGISVVEMSGIDDDVDDNNVVVLCLLSSV